MHHLTLTLTLTAVGTMLAAGCTSAQADPAGFTKDSVQFATSACEGPLRQKAESRGILHSMKDGSLAKVWFEPDGKMPEEIRNSSGSPAEAYADVLNPWKPYVAVHLDGRCTASFVSYPTLQEHFNMATRKN